MVSSMDPAEHSSEAKEQSNSERKKHGMRMESHGGRPHLTPCGAGAAKRITEAHEQSNSNSENRACGGNHMAGSPA